MCWLLPINTFKVQSPLWNGPIHAHQMCQLLPCRTFEPGLNRPKKERKKHVFLLKIKHCCFFFPHTLKMPQGLSQSWPWVESANYELTLDAKMQRNYAGGEPCPNTLCWWYMLFISEMSDTVILTCCISRLNRTPESWCKQCHSKLMTFGGLTSTANCLGFLTSKWRQMADLRQFHMAGSIKSEHWLWLIWCHLRSRHLSKYWRQWILKTSIVIQSNQFIVTHISWFPVKPYLSKILKKNQWLKHHALWSPCLLRRFPGSWFLAWVKCVYIFRKASVSVIEFWDSRMILTSSPSSIPWDQIWYISICTIIWDF